MVDSCNGYFTSRTTISEPFGVGDGVVVSKCEPGS